MSYLSQTLKKSSWLPVNPSEQGWKSGKQLDPDQMSHCVVSDLGLQCLLRPVYQNT